MELNATHNKREYSSRMLSLSRILCSAFFDLSVDEAMANPIASLFHSVFLATLYLAISVQEQVCSNTIFDWFIVYVYKFYSCKEYKHKRIENETEKHIGVVPCTRGRWRFCGDTRDTETSVISLSARCLLKTSFFFTLLWMVPLNSQLLGIFSLSIRIVHLHDFVLLSNLEQKEKCLKEKIRTTGYTSLNPRTISILLFLALTFVGISAFASTYTFLYVQNCSFRCRIAGRPYRMRIDTFSEWNTSSERC